MKAYKDYFDLMLRERYQVFSYEKDEGVRLYVADSIDELTKGLDLARYSSGGRLEVIVPKSMKMVMSGMEEEDDLRTLYMNVFGFSFLDFQYEYPYASAEFSEFPFRDFCRMGVSPFLLQELREKDNGSGIVSLENCHFSHFIGQRYPELINCDFKISRGKKMANEKGEVLSQVPLFDRLRV